MAHRRGNIHGIIPAALGIAGLACGIAVFIKDGNEVKLIMLVFQVINNSTIVSVFYCEVF